MFWLLRYWSSTGKEAEEHGNAVKIEITSITPVLHIVSFQHVIHFGVGISQIEWKLKVKTEISVSHRAKIGQNDHSNPYIESTTVLSDKLIISNTCTYVESAEIVHNVIQVTQAVSSSTLSLLLAAQYGENLRYNYNYNVIQ